MTMLFRILLFVLLFWPTTHRLVAANGETEVTIARGAWGRLARLPNKDWLAVVTRFSRTEPSRLSIYRSTNDSRSWTLLSEVRDTGRPGGRKLDNGHLLTLSNGIVLLACRSLSLDEESFQLPIFRSVDQGRTWNGISVVDASEPPPGTRPRRGLWEPFLFLLPDGRVSAIYSNETHPGYSQILSQKVSPDGGETWGPESRIVEQPDGGNLRPGMGVPARMIDGHYLLAYEVVGMGRGQVHFKISPDGVTWPAGLGTPIPGHEAAPFVTVLASGEIILTSCSNVISTSNDGGKTWHTLTKSPLPGRFKYTWPALYEISPVEIVISISSGAVKLAFVQTPISR